MNFGALENLYLTVPVLLIGLSSDFSGVFLVTSMCIFTEALRRPLVVGL